MQVKDGVATLPGNPGISVALRRSAQARRLNLRVSGLDGRVTLSMPRHLPLTEAMAFLRDKEGWLRAAMARAPSLAPVTIGGEILFRGERLRITESRERRIRAEDGRLFVPPDPDRIHTSLRLATFLKASARAALVPAAEHYAATLGKPFAAISFRDTRSRWGSCTSQGRLMFSWRLIMAPPDVLNYVAAHEVAHLAHMDHSSAFWSCVTRLVPDYAAHRNWLRTHGAQLHGYCFNARPSADNA